MSKKRNRSQMQKPDKPSIGEYQAGYQLGYVNGFNAAKSQMQSHIEHLQQKNAQLNAWLKMAKDKGLILIKNGDVPESGLVPMEHLELAGQAAAQAMRKFYEEKYLPAWDVVGSLDNRIDSLTWFMAGVRTQGKREAIRAALDGMVGEIGKWRDEVIQKTSALSIDHARAARETMIPIIENFQSAVTMFLSNGDIELLFEVTKNHVPALREEIEGAWKKLSEERKLGGAPSGMSVPKTNLALRVKRFYDSQKGKRSQVTAYDDARNELQEDIANLYEDSIQRADLQAELNEWREFPIDDTKGKRDFVSDLLAGLRKAPR